ncbi:MULTISPECIES: SCO family protein [unclassified Hyphomonas]|uniref:SCO family protein n=1 Tax=unclassified Hyphomonas TaxID=2630699 RepID=UPI000551A78B|nr:MULTISPECIES: SCO family protein [unclassified Hyphomonas]
MTRLRMSAALLAGLLAACGPAKPAEPSAGGSAGGCMSRAYPNIGGPISLVNQDGEPVTEETYKGHPTLIYFGFTYCPDVCPMTLVTLKRAYDRLPEDVSPPQTLLISIDPERDTPEQLAQYVSTNAFPDNLQGLTGTPEDVRAAADAFLADYSRIEQPGSQSEYSMDHTSLLYLMDEDWKLKTFFTHEDTDETIATCLTELLE